MSNSVSKFPLSRRNFLGTAALAATALTLGLRGAGASTGAIAAPGASRWPILGFSKPFQHLSPRAMLDLVSEVGWDGIECPVRAGGQIEPARVSDDLPALLEVFRTNGKTVPLLATDITRIDSPHAEQVLRIAAKNGVKRVRLGFFKYDPSKSPTECLDELKPVLKDIVAACRELGLQAGIENHSGANLIGAPVWDVFSLIREMDPASIGFCFDIGHATVEGGLSWPLQAKLIEGFYTAVYAKDFVWKRTPQGWREHWCPLGEGTVSREFFTRLKTTSFRGPISQYHEYELGSTSEMLAAFRHDLQVLRTWIA